MSVRDETIARPVNVFGRVLSDDVGVVVNERLYLTKN
mgnify:FL=1